MIKKCVGCGSILQTHSVNQEGYIQEDALNKGQLCERCFKIRNYGEYKIIEKSNQDFMPIIERIGKTNDLVILVVDIFNISEHIDALKEYLSNPILLVLTKRDILPLSVYDEKLKSVQKRIPLNIIDTVLISSNKNIALDELMEKIKTYKTSRDVYVVGYTNAGKSTMINKIIYNYYNQEMEITTSMLSSTTLNTIEVKLESDLRLIDTPGILDSGDMSNYVNLKDLKQIIPKKEIKPRTYQVKTPQIILIDRYARIDVEPLNNVTLYIANQIPVKRVFSVKGEPLNYEKHEFELSSNQDIVISGLGFLKFTKKGKVIIHTIKNVNVFVRDNLI